MNLTECVDELKALKLALELHQGLNEANMNYTLEALQFFIDQALKLELLEKVEEGIEKHGILPLSNREGYYCIKCKYELKKNEDTCPFNEAIDICNAEWARRLERIGKIIERVPSFIWLTGYFEKIEDVSMEDFKKDLAQVIKEELIKKES